MRYLPGKQQQRKLSAKPSLLAVVACLAGGASVPAMAQSADNHWYFVPQFGVVIGDSERDTDNGVSAALSVGRTLSRVFSVEARAHAYSMSADNLDNDTDQTGLGVDALWYPFGRTDHVQQFAPFVIAGVGYVDTDIGDNFNSSNATANLGFGGELRLGQSPVSLRGEGRYIFDFVDADDADTFNDWQTSLGVAIALNRDEKPVNSAENQPRNTAQDSDGDGIADFEDYCPASRAASTVDGRGCEVKATQLIANQQKRPKPVLRVVEPQLNNQATDAAWPPQPTPQTQAQNSKAQPPAATKKPVEDTPLIVSSYAVQPLAYERAAAEPLSIIKPSAKLASASSGSGNAATSAKTGQGFTAPKPPVANQANPKKASNTVQPFREIVIAPESRGQVSTVAKQPLLIDYQPPKSATPVASTQPILQPSQTSNAAPKAAPKQAPKPKPAKREINLAALTAVKDSDGDGIRDAVDRCKNTKPGGFIDADGCAINLGKNNSNSRKQPTRAPQQSAVAKPVISEPSKAVGNNLVSIATTAQSASNTSAAIATNAAAASSTPLPARNSAAAQTIDRSKLKTITTMVLRGVTFEPDSAVLAEGSEAAISRVAKLMKKQPTVVIEVGGHTDWVGSAVGNLKLSEQRAKAVQNKLEAAGINNSRIDAKGYGDAKPVADNNTAAGRAKNRRIELTLMRPE